MESQSVEALVNGPSTTARADAFDESYRAQFPRLVPLARALCG
jgi:hypothetical protein